MKRIGFLLCLLLRGTRVFGQEETSMAGWIDVTDQSALIRKSASTSLPRSEPQKKFFAKGQAESPPQPVQGAPAAAAAVGSWPVTYTTEVEPEIAEYVTPEISALAQGLQNDPKQIFDFVRNKIRYVHYFGSKKGAHLTLLEKSGNDFDQCALLVALLRAADANNSSVSYTVSYEFGNMQMPYQAGSGFDIKHWIGLTMEHDWAVKTPNLLDLLNNKRGFPELISSGARYCLNPAYDVNKFAWQRVWVKLVISGDAETYYLDPALKMSAYIPGIGIGGAMGFNLGNFLTQVGNGAEINANYVRSLNFNNLKTTLGGYTATLLSALNGPTYKNLSVEEVVSGYRIVETETTTLPTATTGFPGGAAGDFSILTGDTSIWIPAAPGYQIKNLVVLGWENIPAAYMSKMRLDVTSDSKVVNYNTPALRGRKLSLTFPTSNSSRAVLSLDDVVDQSATTGGSGQTATMITSITHPFGVWNYASNPQSLGAADTRGAAHSDLGRSYYRAARGYAIVYGFDDPNDRLIERQKKLDAYLRDNIATTDAAYSKVVTETLEIMGLNWVQQCKMTEEALGGIKNVIPFVHHRVGRAAGNETGAARYYVDMPLATWSGIWKADYSPALDPSSKVFEVLSYFHSASEHGVIEQLQANPSASTIKCLYVANANNKKIIQATSANWSTIAPFLSNDPDLAARYTPAQIEALRLLAVAGSKLLLPSVANNAVGSNWKGYGYVNRTASGFGMNISGGYAGGFGGNSVPINPILTTYQYQNSPTFYFPTPATLPSPYSWDPVDMSDGSFVVDQTDLVTGKAEPRGFSFSRHYDSDRRYLNEASMAHGWTHNYLIKASERSDRLAAFGKRTPQEMASFLVGAFAAYEVYNAPTATYPEVQLWTTTALIVEWAIDQVVDNAVNITKGPNAIQFIKQPTATGSVYVPPAGVAASLTKNGSGNYVLQQRHGNTYAFNSDKQLATIADPYGKALTFTYNGDKQLDLVADPYGRKLDLVYEAGSKRLITVHDNDGSANQRSVSFTYANTYSPQFDLTGVTDPENKTITFEYDGEHKILKTKDAMATPRTIVQNFYDSFGRVYEQRCEGDPTRKWKLYFAGSSSVEENPQGGKTTYYYDDKFRLLGIKDALGNRSSQQYDGQDHVIRSITPKGEISEFVYDGEHHLTQVTEAVGVAGLQRISYLYYEDVPKHLTRIRDFRGQDTSYLYNGFHQVTKVTKPSVNNTLANVVNYGYFADNAANEGELDWFEDQDSYRTSFQYDSRGELTRRTLPDDLNAGTLDYEVFVPNYRGDVMSHTDFRNYTTSYEYNKRRQLTKTTQPGPDGNVVTDLIYDAAGNLWKTIDPKLYVTEQLYDANGKILKAILPELTGLGIPEIENHYDTRNWLDWTENPLNQRTTVFYDAAGRQTGVQDPLLRTVNYGYDANGQRTSVTTPLAINPTQTTTFGFNERGEMKSVTDSLYPTFPITYQCDANGNQTKVINRSTREFVSTYYNNNQLATFKTPTLKTTSYTYKKRGMVDTVTEPSTQTTTSGYDNRGRLNSMVDGVTGGTAWSFTYDANGNLLTHVEGTKTITRTYDSLNRLATYAYADTANPTHNYTLGYQYDNNNNLKRVTYPDGKQVNYEFDSHNRLKTVTDWANRKTTYSYDLTGRMKEVQRPDLTKRRINYNDAGDITSIEELDPLGIHINYFKFDYDSGGRLEREFIAPIPVVFTEPAQTIVPNNDNQIATFNGATVVHDPDGNMTTGPLNADSLITYTYDARNRLTAVIGQATIVNAAWAANNSTTYNLAGSAGKSYVPTSLKTSSGPLVTGVAPSGTLRNNHAGWVGSKILVGGSTMTVTELGRWIVAGNNMSHTVKLVNANGTDVAGGAVTINTAGAAAGQFKYAALASPVTLAVNTAYFLVSQEFSGGDYWYEWDTQVSTGWTYTYDQDDNRITSANGPNVTRYAVNPNAPLPQVLVRTRADGSKTYYVYGAGLVYDVEMTSGGQETGVSRTYHYDYRGSTVAISDGFGRVKERIEYSTYGRITQRTGPQTDTPFLFNGAYGVQTDANSLCYMQARYYNPHLRRFINADPSGFSGGMNFYAYADGNPISLIDPFGLGAAAIDRDVQRYENLKFSIRMEEALSPYVSMGLNMVPGVGAVKGFLELSTGRDLVTGQWHNRSDADLVFQVIATSIIPTPAQPTYSWTPSYVLRTRAAGAAKTGLNPAEINFSQRTVSANVRQYADDMAAGNWDWSRSGPLRVMERDGQWVSYDNRRLMAAQQAGLGEVPVQVVQPGALMPGSSLTWEQAFTRRFSDPRNVQAGGVVPNPGLPTQPSIAPPRR